MGKKKTLDLQAEFNLSARRFISWADDEFNISLPDALQVLEENNLSYLHVDDAGRRERGHALTSLYVYDRKNLQDFLDQNKDVLVAAKWPQEADRFVYYMSYVCAPANSEIFDLIYRCFDDQSDNIWLRRNAHITDPSLIANQQRQAAESRRKFSALHPEFK